ncbi:MAG: FapA family protein [Lachnospiraceae bacterium]|nr:FapA family protein [Lachnospiraceae bacterium]
MDREQEFLSEKEVAELRREIDALVANVDKSGSEPRKKESKAASRRSKHQNILEDLAPLSIEENGSYVRISDDNMQAFLYLMPPGEGKANYTKEELIDFLQKKGVTTGYHQSNISAMIQKKVYRREIEAAGGQAVVHGKDGYYEYKFSPERYRAPEIRPDGSVDYTSMSTLENVKEGAVIAVYHHACPGQDGYDVKGNVIKADVAKEIPALKGQVMVSPDDPDVYLAAKDGKIELRDGGIDIQHVHEIHGDVTLITGKVEFLGDVLIHGNVEAGVTICAGRNIEIRGAVESVNLFAGGDITLCHGIQGAKKAKISAKGNIFADFIEHTIVTAGESVQANTIMNSRVSADEYVILTGKKGAVIGGYTHAEKGIKAAEVGNTSEVRTVVHAGCTKEVYQKAQQLKKRNKEISGLVKELAAEMEECRQKDMDAAESASKLAELEQSRDSLTAEWDEGKSEFQKLEKAIKEGMHAEIIVGGNVYCGTVICLGISQMPVEHTTCFMKYFSLGGRIESNVIAYV